MLGHRRPRLPAPADGTLVVDGVMEERIVGVEESVAYHLARPSEATRGDLRAAVEELDRRLALLDARSASVNRAVLGGRVAPPSLRASVPAAVFAAQVELVKAAKDELRDPTPITLADLAAAEQALTDVRQAWTPSPAPGDLFTKPETA